jgi:hypothetical protein
MRLTAPGKSSCSTRSSLARRPLAGGDVLCDHHELLKKSLGSFDA